MKRFGLGLSKSFAGILIMGVSGLLAVGVSDLGDSESGRDQELSTVGKIKAAGKLVVGTSPEYPPYEFHFQGDGDEDIVGLDIAIAKDIADELGVRLEVKDIIFHDLFRALNSDRVDVVISGLAPSERRKQIVAFSDIYYQAIQNMMVRTKDGEHIAYLKDLRGKKVGVQKGSVQEDIARKQILGAAFCTKDTIPELIADLKSGRADAVILEKPVADAYAIRNKDLLNVECRLGAFDSHLGSAIAVKKGNDDLLVEINKILRRLKRENKIYEYIEDAKILMWK